MAESNGKTRGKVAKPLPVRIAYQQEIILACELWEKVVAILVTASQSKAPDDTFNKASKSLLDEIGEVYLEQGKDRLLKRKGRSAINCRDMVKRLNSMISAPKSVDDLEAFLD